MRVAVFHDLPSGGAKRSLFESVRRLSERHELSVYTLDTADEQFCDLRLLSCGYHTFHFEPPRLYSQPWGRLNQWQRWRSLRRLDSLAKEIAAEIDSAGYDVVFAQPSMWSQAPLVLRYLHAPSVYYCHEPPRQLYEALPPRSGRFQGWRTKVDRVDPLIWLYRAFARQLDRHATRAATKVLVNSRFMERAVRHIYRVRPIVSYHGVDAQLFRPQAHVERGNDVLSVGAIQPSKGFDFIIESIARLPEAVRPALRLIANSQSPGERRYLESLAHRFGVALRIEVDVNVETLVQRYNECGLLAYAPHSEPFGLVPLEAMACGTPVVAVAEGGVPESVLDRETGVLVPRDRARFGEAIRLLLENRKLRETLGQQGRSHVVSNWTWERAVERVERHLRDAPSKSRRGNASSSAQGVDTGSELEPA